MGRAEIDSTGQILSRSSAAYALWSEWSSNLWLTDVAISAGATCIAASSLPLGSRKWKPLTTRETEDRFDNHRTGRGDGSKRRL